MNKGKDLLSLTDEMKCFKKNVRNFLDEVPNIKEKAPSMTYLRYRFKAPSTHQEHFYHFNVEEQLWREEDFIKEELQLREVNFNVDRNLVFEEEVTDLLAGIFDKMKVNFQDESEILTLKDIEHLELRDEYEPIDSLGLTYKNVDSTIADDNNFLSVKPEAVSEGKKFGAFYRGIFQKKYGRVSEASVSEILMENKSRLSDYIHNEFVAIPKLRVFYVEHKPEYRVFYTKVLLKKQMCTFLSITQDLGESESYFSTSNDGHCTGLLLPGFDDMTLEDKKVHMIRYCLTRSFVKDIPMDTTLEFSKFYHKVLMRLNALKIIPDQLAVTKSGDITSLHIVKSKEELENLQSSYKSGLGNFKRSDKDFYRRIFLFYIMVSDKTITTNLSLDGIRHLPEALVWHSQLCEKMVLKERPTYLPPDNLIASIFEPMNKYLCDKDFFKLSAVCKSLWFRVDQKSRWIGTWETLFEGIQVDRALIKDRYLISQFDSDNGGRKATVFDLVQLDYIDDLEWRELESEYVNIEVVDDRVLESNITSSGVYSQLVARNYHQTLRGKYSADSVEL
jgi:hypothetical protein